MTGMAPEYRSVVGSHHFFEADPAIKFLCVAWILKQRDHLQKNDPPSSRPTGQKLLKGAVSKMYDCIQKRPRNSGLGLSFSIESWPAGRENLSLSCELLASQKFFEKVAPGGLKGSGKVV
jgi:hypothetical protein